MQDIKASIMHIIVQSTSVVVIKEKKSNVIGEILFSRGSFPLRDLTVSASP